MAKKLTVAEFIASAIEASGKTNAEIAQALGYTPDRANMISMIRTGRSKLPVNKVGMMARALGIDPGHLLRVVLREYSPDTLAAIEDALGGQVLSEGEQEVVNLMRREANGLAIRLPDEHLLMFQDIAREAAKIERTKHKAGLESASKKWRTDRSEAMSTPSHGRLKTT